MFDMFGIPFFYRVSHLLVYAFMVHTLLSLAEYSYYVL
jgi:hypothetical protein